MTDFTHSSFRVQDPWAADGHEFVFKTSQQGNEIFVVATIPGSGEQHFTLSQKVPRISIPDNGARVRLSGDLRLNFSTDEKGPTQVIFDGIFHSGEVAKGSTAGVSDQVTVEAIIAAIDSL